MVFTEHMLAIEGLQQAIAELLVCDLISDEGKVSLLVRCLDMLDEERKNAHD